jgi:hypothetical protein
MHNIFNATRIQDDALGFARATLLVEKKVKTLISIGIAKSM